MSRRIGKSRITQLSLLAVSIFLFCANSLAQLSLSTIRGTAVDPTGAVVASLDITLVSLETGAKRATKTNENGDYEIPDLQRGTYRLTATASGFKTYVADNIILEGSQIRRINVTLELGAVGTEVTVKENAAVIQTDTAKLQGAISGTKYFDVPWVSAEANLDPSLILTTQPLVSQLSGDVWGAQWAGHFQAQVQEGQDGHTNDSGVNQLNDILDAQEVTVVTVNNTADVARVGYLNMITKSGSNEFHGRASYWNQNSALGAREFFEDTKAKTLIHTTSASVSGPIKKDKIFFFASVNILKVPSKQFYLRTVPTDLMRQGNFSQLLPGRTIKDPLTGALFPGNIIPSSRLNSVALKVNEKYLPAPNRGGPNDTANNYGFTFPFPTDYSLRKDFTQRVDFNLTSKNRLMLRAIENWDLYVLPTNFPAFSWTRVRYNIHTVVEDTHVFSPSLVNSFRVGLYQEVVDDGGTVYGVTPFKGDQAVKDLGIQGVNPKGLSAQGFPVMSISGYPALQTNPGGAVQNDHDWGYAESLTWSRGRHVIKMGGEFKPQSRFVGNVPTNSYGSFSFTGSLAGYGYADFLLGLPFSSTRLDPLTNRTLKDSEFGAYVTDSFKVNSRLTLDLGLRWDRFGSAGYEDGLVYNWDPSTGNVIVPENALKSVSPLYPKTITVVTGPVGPTPSKKNWAPRFGFAYRLTDKTVLRGGYGIFTATNGRYSRLQSAPYSLSETFNNVITNGVPLFAMPNPFPATGSGNIPSQSVSSFPLNTTNGHIHQWNFTIERQVHDIGLRVSYVGSHDYGLNYSVGVNAPAPSLIPFTTSRRIMPQFVNTSVIRNNSESKFNAVTLQAQRKVGQVTFDAHWSLSSNYDKSLLDQFSPLFWYRNGNTPRQRAVLNAVWEVPVGKGRQFLANVPRVVDGVLGGWQIYWIGYLETGKFFSSSYSGYDPTNRNSTSGPPDRVCNGNLPPDQRDILHWFDTKCFVLPPAGRWGNAGSNILEGPGYNMQHFSVAKTFPITERVRFIFTTAFANAFNHPNFLSPSGNISSPDVGVVSDLIQGARARHIELRGRIDF
jgi:hypothetical protein